MAIPICQSLNYTNIRLPNRFGHHSIEDAGIEAQTFYPLIVVILCICLMTIRAYNFS